MGNSSNKSIPHRTQKQSTHSDRDGQAFSSQFTLSYFVGNLSGRSFVSVTSNQSVYSASRPWSRISRRRWNESTLRSPLEASKTAWPVAHQESIFLPEFPIATVAQQKDFQIEATVAKGAFGEVHKIRRVSEDRVYALKVLNKGRVVSENAVRQVKEECRIQTVCGHHPFIVEAVSRWQTKKRLYIVSEYIPGGELLALIDKYKKLPEDFIKIIIAEIAIAIDFLHNAGVIYRDLKPENILLDSEYHIHLIDLGLSKWLSLGQHTTTLCGTLRYMAPEVLSKEPYGHAVDWWSLGVVACLMLTYEFPAPAIGNATLIQDRENATANNNKNQIKAPLTPPGTLPASAEHLSSSARGLLTRLLERNPRVRIRSLRQLQQSAFYMGFNFEDVKKKNASPRSILERHFPEYPYNEEHHNKNCEIFENFDGTCNK